MRTIATLSAALLIALPLAASDEKPSAQQTPAAQPAATAPASDTVQAPATADSPLVAAAKRTKRTGKSKIVITNDTLVKSGSNARVTTTASQPEVKLLPKDPDHDWATMERNKLADDMKAKSDAEAAAKKKADDEARKKKMAALAAAYEEGYSEADPAAVEHELATQNPSQPQSTTTQGQPAQPPQKP